MTYIIVSLISLITGIIIGFKIHSWIGPDRPPLKKINHDRR